MVVKSKWLLKNEHWKQNKSKRYQVEKVWWSKLFRQDIKRKTAKRLFLSYCDFYNLLCFRFRSSPFPLSFWWWTKKRYNRWCVWYRKTTNKISYVHWYQNSSSFVYLPSTAFIVFRVGENKIENNDLFHR